MERQLSFLNCQGQQLQGVLCEAPAAGTCVVLCYPFADERKNSQPAFVAVARALQRHDVSCLRFDYAGCGNSQGRFVDATLAAWAQDAVCAYREMASMGYRRILAVGLRLGANVAWLAGRAGVDFARMLLWNAVESPAAYVRGLRRRRPLRRLFDGGEIARGGDDSPAALDLAGYACGAELVRQLQDGAKLTPSVLRADKRVCIGVVRAPEDRHADPRGDQGPGVIALSSAFWSIPDARNVLEFVQRTVEFCVSNAE